MSRVRLLSLDAGNTIVFLDHELVARLVADTLMGEAIESDVDGARIERAEGIAKKLLDRKQLLAPLPDNHITPAWSSFMSTLVLIATEVDGVNEALAGACTRALWAEHRRFNLWRKVPDGLVGAVGELRARGVPVVVVSNSEGQLQELFDNLGLGSTFDLIIDSHHVAVEKPDPAIFRIALDRFGVAARDALHLGDTFATDIVGARAAGMQVALIDPYGHYDGEYVDVPRVHDVAAACRSIVSALT
jgi:HAD superfamily hydrolase (TIGR01509 family)